MCFACERIAILRAVQPNNRQLALDAQQLADGFRTRAHHLPSHKPHWPVGNWTPPSSNKQTRQRRRTTRISRRNVSKLSNLYWFREIIDWIRIDRCRYQMKLIFIYFKLDVSNVTRHSRRIFFFCYFVYTLNWNNQNMSNVIWRMPFLLIYQSIFVLKPYKLV